MHGQDNHHELHGIVKRNHEKAMALIMQGRIGVSQFHHHSL
jgi:hypothetical protein